MPNLKPRPLGEVAAIADGEGLFPVICGRTQFVSIVVFASYQPVGETCGLPYNNPTVLSAVLIASTLISPNYVATNHPFNEAMAVYPSIFLTNAGGKCIISAVRVFFAEKGENDANEKVFWSVL